MKTKFSTLFLGLSLIISLFTACGSSESAGGDEKLSLEEQEKRNPAKFLTITATYDNDDLGDSNISGTISNSATLTGYKNPVLKVDFFDASNSVIGTQNVTINDYIPSGQTREFKVGFNDPDGTKNVNWTVVSATAE